MCGVPKQVAMLQDLQRYFKCKDGHQIYNIVQRDCNDRGIQYPQFCSVEPCDNCDAFPGNTFNKISDF